jgi:two-component system phosphate regulon sensor histidine kinase PhoR
MRYASVGMPKRPSRKRAHQAAALSMGKSRRRDFIADVTHELMTPITAIKGFAQTLVAGALEDPERRLKFALIIVKHADRLTRLVEDLLEASVLEDGTRKRRGPSRSPKKTHRDRR